MKKEITFERVHGKSKLGINPSDFYKGLPDNCNGIITIEDIDNVKFFQHKYYRGELLEYCSLNSGMTKEECHEYFKSQYLCFRLADGERIPSKYSRRAKIYVREAVNENGETIEQAFKYIPSMGDLSYQDAAHFIQQVELFAVEMWQYSTSSDLREKAKI
jgi:hypothetical protein